MEHLSLLQEIIATLLLSTSYSFLNSFSGDFIMQDLAIVEIHAAEGGDDSKLLVKDQFAIYQRYSVRECL